MDEIDESRINARRIIMRSLTEEEYRATSDKVYRYTLKSYKRHQEQNVKSRLEVSTSFFGCVV